MTLYLKLGGRPAFQEAMKTLENKLYQDGAFRPSQDGRILRHSDELCEFLVFLFGGAPFYDGMPIGTVLQPLRLDDNRYDRFVDHVVNALGGDRSSVSNEAQMRVVMEHIRPHVVNTPELQTGSASRASIGIPA
ncbi:Clp protease ClpP [uncultured Roseibium sp.]|uniref:globin domain-containing protein n=1 Tax=uncultured Roseibium sp. TaxID=1936171 RepID=UPI003217BC98